MTNQPARSLHHRRGAYALLEVLVGVAMLALGVLVMGWAVNGTIVAENMRRADQRVTRVLDNTFQEVLLMPTLPKDGETYEATDDIGSIQIRQRVQPVELKTDDGDDIAGIYRVELSATPDDDESYARAIAFYIYR